VVAAVSAASILFLITVVPMWAGQETTLGAFARWLADQLVFRRYTDFARGVIDTGNLIFFAATTAVFLFLSVKALESRRWR
jgi:gliding motility-associated transport system permease protein